MTPDDSRRAEAVESLSRIRAIEDPPDTEGLRTVWHQTGEGADLLSEVDAEGRVVRQELTLLEDYFHWKAQEGLKTGAAPKLSADAMISSAEVVLDPEISPQRLRRATAAMSSYSGEDRYIRHMAHVLQLGIRGLAWFDTIEVTGRRSISADEIRQLQQPPERPPSRGRALWVIGVVGALVLAGVVAAIAAR